MRVRKVYCVYLVAYFGVTSKELAPPMSSAAGETPTRAVRSRSREVMLVSTNVYTWSWSTGTG
jgi:hypothetical protein